MSSSGSHGHQGPSQHNHQKVPTVKPPSQEATMAVLGAPGLPEFGSAIGSHGHQGPSQHANQKIPTVKPPSQEATMAVSGASGLPVMGSGIGSHGHRGTPQQVNAPAMIGTSSSQHSHACAPQGPGHQHGAKGKNSGGSHHGSSHHHA
ncbi:hypothetical protein NA56DRAFT_707106 [Hyaloscypha hepaticicola]|uniref:Uncharacterized protein n=1 Tax=Hyaloscypha hepaticicola TaxID=2082293 RepID=A0A2J6PVL7_9HELO|nr:hypothetical protein NA56DRAFT_707106 [Hyaloscypha hepaticicola]